LRFNPDDTIQSLTDARAARRQLDLQQPSPAGESHHYSAPAGVTATANVSFEYDAVGNRKSMTDGSGAVSYSYSQLSQVASETRQFNGLSGSYTLAYEYALSGAVNKVTDQTAGTSFSNSLDNSGQVSGVSTVGYGGGVTQFASQMRYRASGGLKSMSYANGTSLSLGYNSRGAMSSFTFSGASYSGTTPLPVAGVYQYYDDGRLKFAQDQGASNSIKDRAYQYDHEGRLREAYSGSEARDSINQTNSATAHIVRVSIPTRGKTR
jgi:hypothetical protein